VLKEKRNIIMTKTKEGGSICGGVISKSMFDSNPWAYMMAYYMDDDKFEVYKKLSKEKADKKSAREWFEKYEF
jgi:hypothetical protein